MKKGKVGTTVLKLMSSSYAYSIVAKGIHIVLGMLVTVFVNRTLGAALKGQYAYVTNMISVLAIIGGLGVYQLYPFYRRKNGESVKKEFINVTLSLAIIYFVSGFAYLMIINVMSLSSSMIIYILMCLITIAKIVDTQFMMFASIDDFKRCKKINIVITIIRFFVFLAIFALFQKNIVAVLIGDLIYDILGIILYSLVLGLKELKLAFTLTGAIKVLKLGIIPMLFQLLLSLNYNIDVIYMKNFSNVAIENIGLYSVGIQLAEYVWTIPDIFKEVLYSKTVKDDSVMDIIWCLRVSIIIEVVFLGFVFLFGDKVLLYLYGKEYVGAISVTKIMIFGVLTMTLFKVLTPLYNAKGKFVVNLIILLTSVAINIIFNVLLIPSYGMLGAAIASVLGYGVCGIVYLVRFCRDFALSVKSLFFFRIGDIIKLFKNMVLLKNREIEMDNIDNRSD